MLDSDRKIPLIGCVNCMCDMFPKVNWTQVFPQWKCRVGWVGGILDRMRVHAQGLGWRYDHKDFEDVRKIIQTKGEF